MSLGVKNIEVVIKASPLTCPQMTTEQCDYRLLLLAAVLFILSQNGLVPTLRTSTVTHAAMGVNVDIVNIMLAMDLHGIAYL